MKRISTSAVGILQGTQVLFADYADGGQMWTGTGSRESRHAIRFNETYHAPPSVMVGMSMWDIDHRHNARAELVAENICAAGFDLVFRTWGDTRVARVRADWTAIGALQDEDDWDVT